MLTSHSLPRRQRRAKSIRVLHDAGAALAALARKALPELPADAIDDMIRGKTLGENIAIMAATRPDVASPVRWAGLMEWTRAIGLEGSAGVAGRPLAVLDLVESAAARD